MLESFLKNISIESQGMISFILGAILILGTLGKFEILQSILNSIMILVGSILVVWGFYNGNGYQRIKDLINKPKEKK